MSVLAAPEGAPLRIAIAGLGTVGQGVITLLRSQSNLLPMRCGRPIEIAAVSARTRDRQRDVDISGLAWHDDAEELASLPNVDAVVELIGGSEGPARNLVQKALENGKAVVTANKALIAEHGADLGRTADSLSVPLAFEAAVAGGIPILKAVREGLSANQISRLYGILNGTCNYILTTMRETGRDFAEVLAEAQALGYAEADPTFDIDGIDAAHKLAILASLAFGREVDYAGVHVEGIRPISATDIAHAEELGYRIKLLGIASASSEGIEQRVHPCLVPLSASIAHIEGVYNAVLVEGDHVGRTLYEGRGAGGGPTASAVVADLMDLARGFRAPPFGVPSAALMPAATLPMEQHRGAYYIRLRVVDRPGVIADIAACLRDEDVSLEAMIQRSRGSAEVPVILTTHDTEEAAMRRALARIAALDSVREEPVLIRIEAL